MGNTNVEMVLDRREMVEEIINYIECQPEYYNKAADLNFWYKIHDRIIFDGKVRDYAKGGEL